MENARQRLQQLHEAEREALRREGEMREELGETRAAVAERDFLRERLVQAETSERELRVLMLRQAEMMQALQGTREPAALPESTTPSESPE